MAKTEPEKGPIQITIPRELAAACERLRASGGDRSRNMMVERIVREADATVTILARARAVVGDAPAAKRKGAK